MKQQERFIERLPQELDPNQNQLKGKLSKYEHKNTLIKLASKPCPVPRKARMFPYLCYLNDAVVTVQQILDLTLKSDISKVLVNPNLIKDPKKR